MLQILLPGHQLSVFSTPTNYRVVKIVRSSSEVVLQTMKHTMIYPGLGNSPMFNGLVLKMNRCYKGVSRELKKFAW
jgi:hypothetical protein